MRVNRRTPLAFQKPKRETELTGAQANVLSELVYGPGRSNAGLARINLVAPQTMVEILMSLERRASSCERHTTRAGKARGTH